MAVSLLFKGTDSSGTDESRLELFANTHNEIYACIEDENFHQHICLSKEDAIRLSKELKKQINIITINENDAL